MVSYIERLDDDIPDTNVNDRADTMDTYASRQVEHMEADGTASFSHVLRRARRHAGLTQELLAERAGISVRAITDLERGVNRTPRRDTLELLAEALELPPASRTEWERLRRRLAVRDFLDKSEG